MPPVNLDSHAGPCIVGWINMAYKNYRFIIIVRVILLAATIALFFFLLFKSSLPVTMIFVAFLAVIQIYGLIRFSETAVREMNQFVQSINLQDYTLKFPSGKAKTSLNSLRRNFNDMIGHFRELRREGEENLHYMMTIVSHIPIGLIALSRDGKISLYNSAAKKLLGVSQLKRLEDIEDPKLRKTLNEIKSRQKMTVRADGNGEAIQLSLAATEIKQRGRAIKLVSVQNITSELAEKEVEAWHQLVRVLTHEIMNSVTPVTSLASTVSEMLETDSSNDKGQIDDSKIDDIRSAVNAIRKRGEGLIHFVEAYRGLSNIPKPDIEIVEIAELLKRIKNLVTSRDDAAGIDIEVDVQPENLKISVDPDLIEQVLLNLCINALHALRETRGGFIRLTGRLSDRSRAIIQVIDNGPGIPDDVKDKLFVPFFSTRPDGTGIGLSLSQQIMRQHNGSILVSSKPNQPTIFTLRF